MIALFRTFEPQPGQLGVSHSIFSTVLWAPQILHVNEITRLQSTPNTRIRRQHQALASNYNGTSLKISNESRPFES